MNEQSQDHTNQSTSEVAYLAGGCFWCIEPVFEELRGVRAAESGYMGGQTASPSYEQVCSGRTGHAEALRVTYDPAEISYSDLLEIFFAVHDPTTLNRQGADVGTQYRSAVFYVDDMQRRAAEEAIDGLQRTGSFPDPVVTEVTQAGPFYRAESFHDDYFKRNPGAGYCRVVIAPKVAKFRKRFGERLKEEEAAR